MYKAHWGQWFSIAFLRLCNCHGGTLSLKASVALWNVQLSCWFRKQWVVFALTYPPYQLVMTNRVATLTLLVHPNAHSAHKTTVVRDWSMDTWLFVNQRYAPGCLDWGWRATRTGIHDATYLSWRPQKKYTLTVNEIHWGRLDNGGTLDGHAHVKSWAHVAYVSTTLAFHLWRMCNCYGMHTITT